MTKSHGLSPLIRRMAMASLTGLLLFAAPGAAQAQTATPPAAQVAPAPRKAIDAKRDRALTRAYRVEQKSLARQTRGFDKVDALIQRINKNAQGGKLTDVQRKAIANAQLKQAEAKTAHAAAADTLRVHSGFDDKGVVVESSAAQATVTTAHHQLADARAAYIAAGRLLKDARK